jgi:hypothetical protein
VTQPGPTATKTAELVTGVALVLGLIVAGVALALWSTWDAGAIVGFLSGIATLGVAMLAQLRATRQVHTIVNQRDTDARVYREDLQDALRDAGEPVPTDRSIKP